MNNTCVGAYIYSAGSQQENLHQSSVTTSEAIYYVLQADTGTCVIRN